MADAVIELGNETMPMFSLQHFLTRLWLTVGADGGIRLDATEPSYLGLWYDAPDAHTEAFAYDFLNWLRDNAASGAVIDGRFIDIAAIELDYIMVCRFVGQYPISMALPA